MGDNSIFSVLSNIWSSVRLKIPPQFQASWWQRLFTLDMASYKNDCFSFYLSHSCAPCPPCIFISYCCLCQCQAVCYYYMPLSTKYHWNISFQKKCSSKYVVKNARNATQFVWQSFSIEFQGFVNKKELNIYTRILDIMKL
jgi:hypothetical protein